MAISIKRIEGIPPFLGLSREELMVITKTAGFTLRHHKKGNDIAVAGKECNAIVIVTSGWLETDTYSDNRAYHIVETIQAPLVIEPDKLFGMKKRYHSTFRALTTCESITISKEDMMQLFADFLIVRLNMLNMICMKSQMTERLPWQVRTTDTKEMIKLFVKQRCRYPAGRKTLHIKMTQLGTELNKSRMDVSNALNALADAEKIILKRGIIEIPALQLL